MKQKQKKVKNTISPDAVCLLQGGLDALVIGY